MTDKSNGSPNRELQKPRVSRSWLFHCSDMVSFSKIELSNKLTLFESKAAAVGSRKIFSAIRNGDLSLLPGRARQSLRRLWGKTRQRNWNIHVLNSDPMPAIIDPENEPQTKLMIKGTTNIFVKIMRAGGAKPTVLVQFPSNERRTFPIANVELAQEIGNYLYRHAVLIGQAKWFPGKMQLADFRVTGLGRYREKTADPGKTLKDISPLLGQYWNDIDPESYLREERGND